MVPDMGQVGTGKTRPWDASLIPARFSPFPKARVKTFSFGGINLHALSDTGARGLLIRAIVLSFSAFAEQATKRIACGVFGRIPQLVFRRGRLLCVWLRGFRR